MSQLDLELILESNSSYSQDFYITLPVAIHVHKYLEQFVYLDTIRDSAIPIAYLENRPTDALRSLVVVNKSHSVLANSPALFSGKKHDQVISKTYSSAYSSIIATDVTITDSMGQEKPLYYRHHLPTGTTEVVLTQFRNGNKTLVDEGYLVDLDQQSVFTNYLNRYDANTGSYQLFFVSGATSDGETFNTLLNSEPVAREATWEDIDLTTGTLTTAYPVYSVERSGSGYTFYFNKGARWFIKARDKGLIQPRRPLAKSPDLPWYLRVTNGDINSLVNSQVRRYRIPEFNTQPFIPYNPIKFGPKEDLIFVSRRVLAANRNNLAIQPDGGLHISIEIYDEEGDLIKVYTTDQSLTGLRVSDTEVFYETDKISSWDNERGFIALATNIFPSWEYHARYYYNADDYEYTTVNLNPVINKKIRTNTYVFYCVPNVDDADKALHHLLVDRDGIILECSQGLGIAHPNLQLVDTADEYNPNTVIGMKYFSEIEDNFLDQYAAGFNNTNAYMILAEITSLDSALIEDQTYIDVRRPGGIIDEDFYQEAVEANPRILQSHLGFGADGQIIPQVGVMVAEPELSLQEDYGGLLTQAHTEELLRLHAPSAGYLVVNWVYPKSEITGSSFTAEQVDLDITWEGPGTYHLYRKTTASGAWELINSTDYLTRTAISYTDTGLSSLSVYYYSVAIEIDGQEYPKSDELSVKVK